MLRIRTTDQSCREFKTEQNDVHLGAKFHHPILKLLWIFWQFSCYYGDYVSQPLEHCEQRAIPAQKSRN